MTIGGAEHRATLTGYNAGRQMGVVEMDSIETIGSTEYATRTALLRIDAITNADTAQNVIFRYGAATGYISAASELYAISETALVHLLDQADAAYDTHPLATGTSADFDV